MTDIPIVVLGMLTITNMVLLSAVVTHSLNTRDMVRKLDGYLVDHLRSHK